MNIQIEIPENYLLIIAAYGNMGSGDLPVFMRMWAQKICRENGLDGKLLQLQQNNVKDLRARLSNTLGEENMQEIDESISSAIQKLK